MRFGGFLNRLVELRFVSSFVVFLSASAMGVWVVFWLGLVGVGGCGLVSVVRTLHAGVWRSIAFLGDFRLGDCK